MEEIVPGVFRIPLAPRDALNAYYADGVLFDTGVEASAQKILGALGDRPLDAVALTHGHVDHVGGAAEVCGARGVPLWCPAGDADAVASGDLRPLSPDNWFMSIAKPSARPVPVDRQLGEGDDVGEFAVVAAPGHSPGQVAYWRARDRVLIAGDVVTSISLATTLRGLHEPPRLFTVDPAQNRRSARALAALDPAVVLVGHGPPVRDGARFRQFADTLPAP